MFTGSSNAVSCKSDVGMSQLIVFSPKANFVVPLFESCSCEHFIFTFGEGEVTDTCILFFSAETSMHLSENVTGGYISPFPTFTILNVNLISCAAELLCFTSLICMGADEVSVATESERTEHLSSNVFSTAFFFRQTFEIAFVLYS